MGFTIEELRNCSGMYSRDLLQQAVNIYNSSFEDEVPLSLLTSAALSFRSSELMSSLLDQVREDNPIMNWNEFSRRFLRHQSSA